MRNWFRLIIYSLTVFTTPVIVTECECAVTKEIVFNHQLITINYITFVFSSASWKHFTLGLVPAICTCIWTCFCLFVLLSVKDKRAALLGVTKRQFIKSLNITLTSRVLIRAEIIAVIITDVSDTPVESGSDSIQRIKASRLRVAPLRMDVKDVIMSTQTSHCNQMQLHRVIAFRLKVNFSPQPHSA